MNPMLQAKPTKIYEEWETTNKIKFTTAPYKSNYATFVEHMLPIFASIPLKTITRFDKRTISMTRTLENLATMDNLKTPSGLIPVEEVFALIKLAYIVNRSEFIKKANRNPELAAFTPLFMYAFKRYPLENKMGSKYEHWDKKDENIEVALGKALYKAYCFHVENPNLIRMALPTELRVKKAGQRKLTDFPKNLHHSERFEETEDPAWTLEFEFWWLVLDFQFWLAHVDLRSSAMILDLENWDKMPKALDANIPRQEVEKPVPAKAWL